MPSRTTGPLAEHGAARRRDDVRRRNDRVADRARAHRFDPDTALPMLCECDDQDCTAFVCVSLLGHEGARVAGCYLVAPGHCCSGTPYEPDSARGG